MYKKQLTLQKILCFAALAACGLVFLYSLGLSTDLYDGLFYALPEEAKLETSTLYVPGAEVYYQIQPFNRELMGRSIMLILLACLLFLTSTHNRRRYYIGNGISTFAFAGAGMYVSLWMHQQIEFFKQKFLEIDFEAYAAYAQRRRKTYIDSTFWFDVHAIVIAVLIIVCAALVINFFIKLYLMNAEKKLVSEGKGVKA